MPTINYDIWQLLDANTSSAYLSNDPPAVATSHFYVDTGASPVEQVFYRVGPSGSTIITQTDGAQNEANWTAAQGGEMINTGHIYETPVVLNANTNAIASYEKVLIGRLVENSTGGRALVDYFLQNGEPYFVYNGTKYTLVDSSNNIAHFNDGDAFKMKMRFKGSTLSVYAYKSGVTYSRILNSTTILAADRSSTCRYLFQTGVTPITTGLNSTQLANYTDSRIGWSTVVVNLNV